MDANTATRTTAAQCRYAARMAWIDTVRTRSALYCLQALPVPYTDAVADAQVTAIDDAYSVAYAASQRHAAALSLSALADAAAAYDWNKA